MFFSSNWNSPLERDVRPDTNVLIFTTLIALLTGIGFGILPAFRSSGVDVAPALKENAVPGATLAAMVRGRFRLGNSLVIGQVVLSFWCL